MKTWSGSEVHWSRCPRVLLGWVRFLWAKLWCRHDWHYARRIVINQRGKWREYHCPKCGARQLFGVVVTYNRRVRWWEWLSREATQDDAAMLVWCAMALIAAWMILAAS